MPRSVKSSGIRSQIWESGVSSQTVTPFSRKCSIAGWDSTMLPPVAITVFSHSNACPTWPSTSKNASSPWVRRISGKVIPACSTIRSSTSKKVYPRRRAKARPHYTLAGTGHPDQYDILHRSNPIISVLRGTASWSLYHFADSCPRSNYTNFFQLPH